MKDMSAKGRKTSIRCLNKFSMTAGIVLVFGHPEPGPELNSGSMEFSISFFWFTEFGF
jgi:hypothetical protein